MRRDLFYTAITALALGAVIFTLPAAGEVIYDSIPAPLPPNVPSLGYQATQTSEFGDLIQFAGTRRLQRVTLVMSDWALASDYPSFPGSAGPTWNHPLTLNLYNVDNSGPNPAPGTLIATRTQTFAIPWRPPADPTCPEEERRGGPATETATAGLRSRSRSISPGHACPNQIIYGVAFNTQTWGYISDRGAGTVRIAEFRSGHQARPRWAAIRFRTLRIGTRRRPRTMRMAARGEWGSSAGIPIGPRSAGQPS